MDNKDIKNLCEYLLLKGAFPIEIKDDSELKDFLEKVKGWMEQERKFRVGGYNNPPKHFL